MAALVKLTPRTIHLGLGNADLLLALMATQLLFMFTYAPSPDQGIITGIIIGASATANFIRRRSSVLPARKWTGGSAQDRPRVGAERRS